MSTMTVSRPSARARSRPARVASTGSCVSVRKTGTSIWAPSCSSWSIAAGRWRSAAMRPGLRPSPFRRSASFAAVGRLARALEAGEQDHRLPAEVELGRVRAEQLGELVVDDLHDLLARGEALQHLLAERALAHPLDEAADDLEVDVGLDQREADLAHRARDRLLVEPAALAQVAEDAAEPVGEGVEHRRPVYWPPRPSAAATRPDCHVPGEGASVAGGVGERSPARSPRPPATAAGTRDAKRVRARP